MEFCKNCIKLYYKENVNIENNPRCLNCNSEMTINEIPKVIS